MESVRVIAWALATTAISCGAIDPAPIEDDDGNEIFSPTPFVPYLEVVAAYPSEVPPTGELQFAFDQYIEDDELLDFSVVSLSSGGLSQGGRVTWDMTTRSLFFRPYTDLIPNFVYKPSLDATRLTSLDGAPLGPHSLPSFRVVEPEEPAPAPPQVRVDWSDVADVLEAKCWSCHADPKWNLNPLTRESMLGVSSEQTETLLVVPFDPADSYLMHKILPAYLHRRFTVQPPPWSGATPLLTEEVALIERWILTGARD